MCSRGRRDVNRRRSWFWEERKTQKPWGEKSISRRAGVLLPKVADICTEVKIQILQLLNISALKTVSVEPFMVGLPNFLTWGVRWLGRSGAAAGEAHPYALPTLQHAGRNSCLSSWPQKCHETLVFAPKQSSLVHLSSFCFALSD